MKTKRLTKEILAVGLALSQTFTANERNIIDYDYCKKFISPLRILPYLIV